MGEVKHFVLPDHDVLTQTLWSMLYGQTCSLKRSRHLQPVRDDLIWFYGSYNVLLVLTGIDVTVLFGIGGLLL